MYIPDFNEILEFLKNAGQLIAAISKIASEISKLYKTYQQINPAESSGQKNDTSTPPAKEALNITLKEWENIAYKIDPKIEIELGNSIGAERAKKLSHAMQRRVNFNSTGLQTKNIHLLHSTFSENHGALSLELGTSPMTASLKGQEIPLKEEIVNLPTFKITMLGDSGSGKTIYMAAMYAKLREGIDGISLRAVDLNVDNILGALMQNLYSEKSQEKAWPPGTEKNQIDYEFELKVHGIPLLRIDWVDYRGGAVKDQADSTDTEALLKRLQESHAILWMIDMSVLQANQKIDSLPARIATQASRMGALCREAMSRNQGSEPKSWIFVRTKSDLVQSENVSPDWELAVNDLVKHLGSLLDIARKESGPYARAAAMPVSASGRVLNKIPVGDDPSFVEWPLLLSLAFLLELEVNRLKKTQKSLSTDLDNTKNGLLRSFAGLFVDLDPSDEHQKLAIDLTLVTQKIMHIKKGLERLLKEHPTVIKKIC